jgi:hypothetical protein
MKRRALDAAGENPSYRYVELRMTKQEWLDWALPRYIEFLEKNPHQSPNAARIGDVGHYEIGNIEIVTAAENLKTQTMKRRTRIDGLKPCSRCKRRLAPKEFNRRSSAWDGLQSFCRECTALRYRERRSLES